MKKVFALSLLLALAGATIASATSVPVILNPNFTSTPTLLSVQSNNDPDFYDGATTPSVSDWTFTTYYYAADVSTYNLSGIAGPDLTPGSGETQDEFHFTAPPDGASQFAFLSSGSSVVQSVTGFTSGDLYVLTFSAESYCIDIVPITVTFNGGQSATDDPPITNAYSNPQTGWETFSVDFVADSSSETIDFSTNASDYPDTGETGPLVALSDPIITPEPSSLYLFGTGLFGLAFVAFRRVKLFGLVLHNK
jgi:hypothetical protein